MTSRFSEITNWSTVIQSTLETSQDEKSTLETSEGKKNTLETSEDNKTTLETSEETETETTLETSEDTKTTLETGKQKDTTSLKTSRLYVIQKQHKSNLLKTKWVESNWHVSKHFALLVWS